MDLCILQLLKGEIFATWEPICQMQSRRILPRHDTRSRWGTNMTSCIRLSELDTFLSQSVNMGSVVEFTSIAADISPTEVINKKEDYVRLSLRCMTSTGD